MIEEDDDFTDAERESKELEEFDDVWRQAQLRILTLLHEGVKEAIESHDESVADMLKAALEAMNLDVMLLKKPTIRLVEFDESAFIIWRKWHPRPE